MHRRLALACLLGCACAAPHEVRALDVTTTAATVRSPAAPDRALDAALEARASEAASVPTPLPSPARTDVQIATKLATAVAAVAQRASFARAHVADGRARDFAQVVYERTHEAELTLSFGARAPAVPLSMGELRSLASTPRVDFDRAYVDLVRQDLGRLLEALDTVEPHIREVALRVKVMDLRPALVELYARASDLEQALLNPGP